MKRKLSTIDLGILWWYDACVQGDENTVKSLKDLPLQQSAGVIKRIKGTVKLIQNKMLQPGMRKDDEITDVPTSLIKSAIVIKLVFKNGLPESGKHIYEVEI